MANTKEIQSRINSIHDTMKITKAMYMMSSVKLRKARQKLEDTEPYFYGLQDQIKSILYHFPTMQHLFFDNRNSDMHEQIKKKAFIVISGDKGMAGAYNHNVLKEAKRLCDESQEYKIFAIGETGRQYFTSLGYNVEESFRFSANNPSVHRARVITEEIVERYKKEEMDEVYIVYTKMEHGMKEEVQVEQLLPLKKADFNIQIPVDFKREELALKPSPEVVMDRIVPDYIVGFVYGALVESFSCEQNARMMAMEAASKSAKDMLHDLDIQYNRARQASITQEITEVIAGAKSQKKKRKK